jgi:lysozyme
MGWSLRDVPSRTTMPGSTDPRDVVCADGETLAGIDVSKWQGEIDWTAVAGTDTDFAFVRVSDGLGYIDEWFEVNWEQARANGIYTGVYQFFRPGQDPVEQAWLLLDKMGPLPPDGIVPVIDVEDAGGLSPAEVTAAIHAWVDVVEGELGVTPIVYTGKYFWQDYVQTSEFADYPLWVAQYGPVCPDLPSQWSDWVFHQTSASGSVSGVPGDVDTNVFNGDLGLLGGYLGGGECGDGYCNGDETPDSCAEDCPPCGVIGADGGVVDETDACFERFGDEAYWREETVGWEQSLIWTHTTEWDAPSNYAVWRFHLAEAGEYDLAVFVEDGWSESTQSAYRLRHDGMEELVALDQASSSGWASLGTFSFAAGGDQWLRLDDNTGEANDAMIQLVFDAARLTPTEGEGDDVGAEDEGGTGDGDGDTDGGGQADGEGDESGCGCTSATAPRSAWMLLLVVATRRRRR